MLNIKNVSAKNFMSIGAQTQAVNFDQCQLTLVLGHNLDLGGDGSRNGTGKTTIVNALSYGLYGDALTNIRKDNLINKTNAKGMIVSVEFEKDGTEYRIERGRRPNTLKFFVNGTNREDGEQQGDSRETQKEIEKIIGFPHEMFKQLIALNTYTEPFLSLKANDQRAMIEQLLGITELSLKADVLKELLKYTKDSIKEEEIRITAVKNSNERVQRNIKDIESRGKAWAKTKEDKVADMQTSIDTLEEIDVEQEIERHKSNAILKESSDVKTTLETELERILTSLLRSSKKLETLKSNLLKAQEGVCPACEQSTAHLTTHEKYTNELISDISEEEVYNKELTDRQNEVEQAVAGVGVLPDEEDTFYNTLEDALSHKHNLDTLITNLDEKINDINPYDDQVVSLKETGLEEIDFETVNELTFLKDHQEFLYKLLTSKDSFIRKRIIDQNIAYLNHRLAYYLDKLGLPHEVKFSSDLSVLITEYGRDLDFDNLSRGERNRLILGLSWAFRDIYESLNHPMNLMCVDELIDSGMDTTGVENALAVLKKMHREQGKSIFLISHKEELVGRVNNVLTVIKEGGFTSYNTDTEYVN
jgi:DNA repair exonuclease SbcCD ATPase subunit|tara:strand:+ start:4791 stop:6557 length:1767 start_codon:yes stop_codon:yes gene_type:complete